MYIDVLPDELSVSVSWYVGSSGFDGVYLSMYKFKDFTDLSCYWLVQVCWLLSYLS